MTGRDIMADCDDLFEILAKMTLNKPFINSYLASSICVEAKYYFLIHFINFRNKRPNKNPQKPKMAKFDFLAFCQPLINPLLRVISRPASAERLNITFYFFFFFFVFFFFFGFFCFFGFLFFLGYSNRNMPFF